MMDSIEEEEWIDPVLFYELKKENEKLKIENISIKLDFMSYKLKNKQIVENINKILHNIESKQDSTIKNKVIEDIHDAIDN